jgi:hypothetical protein
MTLNPAEHEREPAETQQYKLHAMAVGYPTGHLWDKLDAKTCLMASYEIAALRKATTQPAAIRSAGLAGERAAFEHWFSDEGKYPKSVERGKDSPTYKLMAAHLSWTAWQARATISATAAEVRREALELTTAARDVLDERHRQLSEITPEDDDQWACDELAALACLYAMPPAAREWDATSTGYGETLGDAMLPPDWHFKPGNRREELRKAGALILAEIERIDRASAKGGT